MIRLETISKTFNDRKVLDDISLTFEEGKIYLLKGISGSGKSTLMNIIAGLDENYKGTLDFDGKKKPDAGQISYMLQHSILVSGISVLDNLKLICRDEDLILQYAEYYGMKDYLGKMPEMLSGGERQRIALIRCLLKHPHLILADEPTAALDRENAALVAEQMNRSRKSDTIIIIATHEDSFDGIADEVIDLKYGHVRIISAEKNRTDGECVDKEMEESDAVNCIPKEAADNGQFLSTTKEKVQILSKRKRNRTSQGKTLLYSLFFSALFLAVILQYNVKKLVTQSILGDSPITTFSFPQNAFLDLKDQYGWQVYDNYQITGHEYKVYSLLDREHSGLSREGMIEFGIFPENNQEVLVNQAFIRQENKMTALDTEPDFASYIGTTISIREEEFCISGILCDFERESDDTKRRLYQANSYYETIHIPAVYVPQEKMSAIGERIDSDEVMVTLEDVYLTRAEKELREYLDSPFSIWDEEVVAWKQVTDAVCIIFYVICILLCFVIGLFIKNEIMLEFYYRKREIGCLQIIGLSKKDLKVFLYFEKFMKYFPGVAGGGFVTAAVLILVSVWMKTILFLPVFRILVVLTGIAVYITGTVVKPCRRILDTPIVELI